MKKRKGTVADVLMSLVVVFALIFLMLAYLNLTAAINRKEDIDQLARRYILEMETIGYLSGSSQTQFVQQLHELGIENVDLSGTTVSQAGYGNPIYLYVQGSIPLRTLDNSSGNLFTFFLKDTTFPVEIRKMSTAKN